MILRTFRLGLASSSIILLAACGGDTSAGGTSTSPAHPLVRAQFDCSLELAYATDGDNYHTLTLDERGRDDDGGLSPADITCVLDKLGATDAVKAHVDATREIDGMQTDSWHGYTARWTFSAAQGLTLTIHQT
jgi:hypothetical protein